MDLRVNLAPNHEVARLLLLQQRHRDTSFGKLDKDTLLKILSYIPPTSPVSVRLLHLSGEPERPARST